MKIFTAEQTRQWDQFTIVNEPVTSFDLMERAASRCTDWIIQHFSPETEFLVFCGKGNNGGDGLAIARMLVSRNWNASVFILETNVEGSPDFLENVREFEGIKRVRRVIKKASDIPPIDNKLVIIDALFGSGLNRPLEKISSELVQAINSSGAMVLSIDIPSGLFADKNSSDFPVIQASYTLTFQRQKIAFLVPENASFTGDVVVLDIGLQPQFEENTSSRFVLLEKEEIRPIFKPRKKYSHKGNYGHAIIFSGSYGMMGAAILAAKSGLKSGAGKITAAIPSCGLEIIQVAAPEVICLPDKSERHLATVHDTSLYDAVAIGPGIGMHASTVQWFEEIIPTIDKPLVLDADALNIIAHKPQILENLPAGTILTPHPKEFERLFGKSQNDFEKLELALQKASQFSIFIILKGYHSFIACPDGKGYFNDSGNPGMATAGSGDVLTGMLAGLLAQSYVPLDVCKAGVFLHGMAGDIGATTISEAGLVAGDIVDCIGKAFLALSYQETIASW